MSLCRVWFGSFPNDVLLEGNDHLQASRGLLHKKMVSRSKAICICSAELLRSGMENHEEMGLVLDLKRPEDSNRKLPRVVCFSVTGQGLAHTAGQPSPQALPRAHTSSLAQASGQRASASLWHGAGRVQAALDDSEALA